MSIKPGKNPKLSHLCVGKANWENTLLSRRNLSEQEYLKASCFVSRSPWSSLLLLSFHLCSIPCPCRCSTSACHRHIPSGVWQKQLSYLLPKCFVKKTKFFSAKNSSNFTPTSLNPNKLCPTSSGSQWMPILPKSLTVNHSAADWPCSINLEGVPQFLASNSAIPPSAKASDTQHASVRGSGKFSLWRCMRDGVQGQRLQHWAPGSAQPSRGSHLRSHAFCSAGWRTGFPRAAQTASGEYHGVCKFCPLCLWSGLASADTGNKTQLYWWISPF